MTAKVSYQNWRTQRPAPELESVGEHLDEVYDTLTERVFGGCLRLEGEGKQARWRPWARGSCCGRRR